MAFSARQITLTASTPTVLLVQGTGSGTTFKSIQGSIQDPLPIIIQNTGATTVYIGGPDVSATAGFPLAQNQSLPMALYNPSELPYAFTTGTGIVVAILCGRQ